MTIAYLTSEYPALSHTFIRREIAALCAEGLDIVPFSVRPAKIDWGEDVPAILGQSKLRLIWMTMCAIMRAPIRSLETFALSQRHRTAGLRGWVWSLFHFIEALTLSEMLKNARATRLHSHFANSGATVGMLAARQNDIPWSLTLHGISETDHPAGALLADKLKRADFVVCASWFMQAQAMRITSPDIWHKYHIVRCGVNLPADRPTAKTRVANFCTVGRVSAEKGYAGLLQAVARLKAKNLDVHVTVVGDGPMRAEVERQIAEQSLSGHFTLLGALPEAQTLAEIAKADAFVLPSLMEGLPVVLMEAMAAGKPAIAAMVAGIPELIEHDRTGLLFEVGNWADLEGQMQNLIKNPELARRLGEAGRVRVEQEFVITQAAQPLVALFQIPTPTTQTQS